MATTFYDLRRDGFRSWWFPLIGLSFFFWGIFLFSIRKNLGSPGPISIESFLTLYIGFSCVLTIFSTAYVLGMYSRMRKALVQESCQFVEGTVSEYKLDQASRSENFVVSGKKFCYSESAVTVGFNQTRVSGGPIREDLLVRIWFVDDAILRLDIENQ